MVATDAGDDGQIGGKEVDGVQSPPQADLKDRDVRAGAEEEIHGRQGAELEIGQGIIAPGGIDPGEGRAQVLIGHLPPPEADALVIADEVRRGIGRGAITGRAIDGLQQGDRGTLAVGTGHGDDRKGRLSRPEPPPDPTDPVQAQIDHAGVQGFLPGQPVREIIKAHEWYRIPCKTCVISPCQGKLEDQGQFLSVATAWKGAQHDPERTAVGKRSGQQRRAFTSPRHHLARNRATTCHR